MDPWVRYHTCKVDVVDGFVVVVMVGGDMVGSHGDRW